MIPLPRLIACLGLVAGLASVGLAATHASGSTNGQAFDLSDPAPPLRLVLLVNLPDGRQTETELATLPEAVCLPAMRAIWRANADAPLVGFDEYGPIPAFDAACLPE